IRPGSSEESIDTITFFTFEKIPNHIVIVFQMRNNRFNGKSLIYPHPFNRLKRGSSHIVRLGRVF
ncbi:hypothetical protein, partial [Leptospira santarosai]|uniref:hypothetical protein n=1 Tax=Leptospira santarosai TaxID=28183 RepID=UPI004035C468